MLMMFHNGTVCALNIGKSTVWRNYIVAWSKIAFVGWYSLPAFFVSNIDRVDSFQQLLKMRVTLALHFRGYGRSSKWNSNIRKRWTKMGESSMRWRALPPARLAPELGPCLQQAEDMFHSDRYTVELLRSSEWLREDWQPPVDLVQKLEEVEGRLRAPLQPAPRLVYGWPKRLEAGLTQAALLTNCQVRTGLCPTHQLLLEQNADEMDTQELRLLQEAVLHAHLWQTDEEHLPRRVHREKLQIVPRAEYGIHPVCIVRYLLENLTRLAATSTLGAADRLEVYQHRLLERLPLWQNTPIYFDELHDLAVFGTSPLPVVLSENDASGATGRPHSMAPVSPLVDMHLVERYFEEDPVISSGLPFNQLDFLHRHPHLVSVRFAQPLRCSNFCVCAVFVQITVNLALPNTWSDFQEPESRPVLPKQRAGALLLSAYAQAASSARERFGARAVEEPDHRLPAPVVCIHDVFIA